MTFLVERLADLRRHLDHLRDLVGKVEGPATLERDLSLHNDVLFSLLMVTQLVVDIAGELSARDGLRFEDYTEAVRNLRRLGFVPDEVVAALEPLPGFRNVVLHEYVALDLQLVVDALHELEPVERFLQAVRELEASG